MNNRIFLLALFSSGLASLAAPINAQLLGSASDLNDSHKPQSHATVSPLVIFSNNIGDIGREAASDGVPLAQASNKSLNNPLGINYLDVDSIPKEASIQIFDKIRLALNNGGLALIESSQYDFENLRRTITEEFSVNATHIEDVAVLLRRNGTTITATSVDSSEVAEIAGIQRDKTTSGRMARELANLNDSELTSSNKALPSYLRGHLKLAALAYESDPVFEGYALRYNTSRVDLWTIQAGSATRCFVAWRGTDPTSLVDIIADLETQNPRIIPVTPGHIFSAGKGLVDRVEAYRPSLDNRLESYGCDEVNITGHSLGGAVAQVHAIQVRLDPVYGEALLNVVAWNSPNVYLVGLNNVTTARRLITEVANLHVACRRFDFLVNSVPLGFARLGTSTTPVGGCTYVGDGVRSANPNRNHNLSLWYDDF